MKTIIVTGTPGTGKTSLARAIAKKFNFHYIDANIIIKKYNITEGYDRKRKTKIIDTNKLNNALLKEINQFRAINEKQYNKKSNKKDNSKIKGIVIDSHLSHYLPRKYVDLCIVTECDIKELKKRLKARKYPKAKIEENLQAEIFDICLIEANEKGHKVLAIDTTKGININSIKKSIIK